MEFFIQILILALGFIMLVKGADMFVDGSSGIATKFRIPQLIIGLTIVAMGTSTPEAAVSIAAAIKGNADITVGNIVGSNILNIFIILGISALITPLCVASSTIKFEIPIMIASTFLLLLLGRNGNIEFTSGIIFIVSFIAYLYYLFVSSKNSTEQHVENTKITSVSKAVIFTVVGLFLVVTGSNFTVNSATKITIDEICNKIHISKYQLCRIFKENVGVTIGEFIKSRRLSVTKQLLAETNLSITRIAEKCCFTDSGFFSKTFSKEFNITPTEFRKKYR